jgi:hypothetical protein
MANAYCIICILHNSSVAGVIMMSRQQRFPRDRLHITGTFDAPRMERIEKTWKLQSLI